MKRSYPLRRVPLASVRECKLTLSLRRSNALPCHTEINEFTWCIRQPTSPLEGDKKRTSSTGVFRKALSYGPPAAARGPLRIERPTAMGAPWRRGATALTPSWAIAAASWTSPRKRAQSSGPSPRGSHTAGAYSGAKPSTRRADLDGSRKAGNAQERMRIGVGVLKHSGGGSSGPSAERDGCGA
jgi:hypothetical protein